MNASLFFTVGDLGCCPGCGAEIEYHSLNPIWGKPFELCSMLWVSESVWYKPWTWFSGHWIASEI